MIEISSKGKFERSTKYFKKLLNFEILLILQKYGKQGVEALKAATPRDTGKTAESWKYDISENNGSYAISWSNSNVIHGINIALILDQGHGTRNGGYVVGRNYINPTIMPIFDEIANKAWQEVTEA